MNQTKKAALYVLANNPATAFEQTVDLAKYAQNNDLEISSETFFDVEYTEYALQRPGLTSLLTKTFFGKFDADIILIQSPSFISFREDVRTDVLHAFKPIEVIFTSI